MRLIYANQFSTLIKVTLEEGEHLGRHSGPLEGFVPTDLANTDFAEIDGRGLSIEPYEQDVPPIAPRAARPSSLPPPKKKPRKK